jgi:hypothetical protein
MNLVEAFGNKKNAMQIHNLDKWQQGHSKHKYDNKVND